MSISYSTSKAGVIGFTRQVAAEYAAEKIRVNAIAPGWHGGTALGAERRAAASPEDVKQFEEAIHARIPMKHRGVPDDLVGLVVYLASDASHYVTGQVIAHDGGWDARGGVTDDADMPEFTVEFGKDGAAAGGRPPRRRGVPPQPRGDRAGARSLSARPHRRRAGDRQRHRPARGRIRRQTAADHLVADRLSTTIICAASPPGATHAKLDNVKAPVRLDASAADWRLPALGLPTRIHRRCSAPT